VSYADLNLILHFKFITMALPNLFAKRFLGIDVGTSAVRIVELEDDAIPKLTNYGELKTEVLRKDMPILGKKAMAFFRCRKRAQ